VRDEEIERTRVRENTDVGDTPVDRTHTLDLRDDDRTALSVEEEREHTRY
jgi:hypothetical protein